MLQAKERVKRNIEILEKTFEIEKIHSQHVKIEAQNQVEQAELAVS